MQIRSDMGLKCCVSGRPAGFAAWPSAGISRQGVRDVIVRAEAALTELEDKTGLIKRFHTMRAQLEQVRQDAERVAELSARQDSAELEALALRIRDTSAALLEE